jgi:hypothetical protein
MADEQQRPLDTNSTEQIKHIASLHVAGESGMQLKQLTLGLLHLRQRKLRGFTRPRLGARQDRSEADLHPRQRHARDASLALAALGQPSLSVATRAVGLCVGMTEQPKLTDHSHEVLRA